MIMADSMRAGATSLGGLAFDSHGHLRDTGPSGPSGPAAPVDVTLKAYRTEGRRVALLRSVHDKKTGTVPTVLLPLFQLGLLLTFNRQPYWVIA
jgi:hypothetical protein